ncbi:MAG TPA: amidohydrolase [Halanaerobiales bacterium]|nr:amidohydrolase [Halanaerobiales bacterium]
MKAIVNAKILTMEEKVYEKGSILIDGKKIEKVGKDMEIPQGIEIIDASKKIIMPGLIDGHTHLGIGEEDIGWAGRDYNETTDPITPQLSALDAINPQDNGFSDAYKNGVTTVMVAPGSANVIGGECTVLKTYGNSIDKMVIKKNIGLKAALGENPKGVYGDKDKMPSTRMAVAALLRKALIDAKNYLAQKKEKTNENNFHPIDIKMEKIAKVIKKEIPLRIHAHRSDDIMTALRIAKEFDINIIIEHCTEGHLIAEEINSANIPVMVGPSFGGRSKVELKNKSFKTAGILNEKGVKVAIISDHSVTPTQYLPLYAALSIKAGMDEIEALKAITINPAKIMGIDDKVGSIKVGKDADLVIFDKKPLDVMAKVEKVFINGKIVN